MTTGRTVRQRIIPDVIPGGVEEYKENNNNASSLVRHILFECKLSVSHGDCPRDVNDQHANCASEEHGSSLESWGDQSDGCAVDEAPCGVPEVDHRLRPGIRVSDHDKDLAQVEPIHDQVMCMKRVGNTHEIKVFPDHWVNRPIAAASRVRRRMPGVRTISIQDCFAASNSKWIVVSIWAISALTKMESRSPSAWYFARISKASSRRSLLMRKRGLSGRKLSERQCVAEAV